MKSYKKRTNKQSKLHWTSLRDNTSLATHTEKNFLGEKIQLTHTH